jgi:hypothetical protein
MYRPKPLDQKILNYLTNSGKRFSAASLARIIKADPHATALTLGRMAKQGLVETAVVTHTTTGNYKNTEKVWMTPAGAAKWDDSKVASDDPIEVVGIPEPPNTGTFLQNFRPLDKFETAMLERMAERGKVTLPTLTKCRVAYIHDKNSTVALVKNGTRLFGGWSKYNPNDANYVPEIGEQIALSRAMKNGPIQA